MNVGNFDVVYTTRNVNSKRLLKTILQLIEDVLNDGAVSSHVAQSAASGGGPEDTLQYIVENEMQEMLEKGLISQYDVIADHRNNVRSEVERGVFHILLKFRQIHCLNETKLDFTITLIRRYDDSEY